MHSNSSKGAIGPPNDVSNNDQEYLKGKIKQYLYVEDIEELVLVPIEID